MGDRKFCNECFLKHGEGQCRGPIAGPSRGQPTPQLTLEESYAIFAEAFTELGQSFDSALDNLSPERSSPQNNLSPGRSSPPQDAPCPETSSPEGGRMTTPSVAFQYAPYMPRPIPRPGEAPSPDTMWRQTPTCYDRFQPQACSSPTDLNYDVNIVGRHLLPAGQYPIQRPLEQETISAWPSQCPDTSLGDFEDPGKGDQAGFYRTLPTVDLSTEEKQADRLAKRRQKKMAEIERQRRIACGSIPSDISSTSSQELSLGESFDLERDWWFFANRKKNFSPPESPNQKSYEDSGGSLGIYNDLDCSGYLTTPPLVATSRYANTPPTPPSPPPFVSSPVSYEYQSCPRSSLEALDIDNLDTFGEELPEDQINAFLETTPCPAVSAPCPEDMIDMRTPQRTWQKIGPQGREPIERSPVPPGLPSPLAPTVLQGPPPCPSRFPQLPRTPPPRPPPSCISPPLPVVYREHFPAPPTPPEWAYDPGFERDPDCVLRQFLEAPPEHVPGEQLSPTLRTPPRVQPPPRPPTISPPPHTLPTDVYSDEYDKRLQSWWIHEKRYLDTETETERRTDIMQMKYPWLKNKPPTSYKELLLRCQRRMARKTPVVPPARPGATNIPMLTSRPPGSRPPPLQFPQASYGVWDEPCSPRVVPYGAPLREGEMDLSGSRDPNALPDEISQSWGTNYYVPFPGQPPQRVPKQSRGRRPMSPQPGPSRRQGPPPGPSMSPQPGPSWRHDPPPGPSVCPQPGPSRRQDPPPGPSMSPQPGPSWRHDPPPGPSVCPQPCPSRRQGPPPGPSTSPQPGPSWRQDPPPGPSMSPQPGPSWRQDPPPGPSVCPQPGPFRRPDIPLEPSSYRTPTQSRVQRPLSDTQVTPRSHFRPDLSGVSASSPSGRSRTPEGASRSVRFSKKDSIRMIPPRSTPQNFVRYGPRYVKSIPMLPSRAHHSRQCQPEATSTPVHSQQQPCLPWSSPCAPSPVWPPPAPVAPQTTSPINTSPPQASTSGATYQCPAEISAEVMDGSPMITVPTREEMNAIISSELCRYGTTLRNKPRTASCYRPPPERTCPLPSPRTQERVPLEGVYGPHLPMAYGSTRPPPRTSAGRLPSAVQPAPPPQSPARHHLEQTAQARRSTRAPDKKPKKSREKPPDPTRSEIYTPDRAMRLECRVLDIDERIRKIEIEVFEPSMSPPGIPEIPPILLEQFEKSISKMKCGVSRLKKLVEKRKEQYSLPSSPFQQKTCLPPERGYSSI